MSQFCPHSAISAPGQWTWGQCGMSLGYIHLFLGAPPPTSPRPRLHARSQLSMLVSALTLRRLLHFWFLSFLRTSPVSLSLPLQLSVPKTAHGTNRVFCPLFSSAVRSWIERMKESVCISFGEGVRGPRAGVRKLSR